MLEEETGYYNITIPLIYSKKFSRKEKKTIINNLISEFEIENINNKKVKYMSGGERQKIAICRAIINEPEVLILDEPTASLIPRLKSKFYNYIFGQIKDDTTVILVSHDISYFDDSMFKKFELSDGSLIAAD